MIATITEVASCRFQLLEVTKMLSFHPANTLLFGVHTNSCQSSCSEVSMDLVTQLSNNKGDISDYNRVDNGLRKVFISVWWPHAVCMT